MWRSADWCGSGAAVVRRVVWSAKTGLQAVCNFRLLRVLSAVEMAHAAERGLVWIRRWRGVVR